MKVLAQTLEAVRNAAKTSNLPHMGWSDSTLGSVLAFHLNNLGLIP